MLGECWSEQNRSAAYSIIEITVFKKDHEAIKVCLVGMVEDQMNTHLGPRERWRSTNQTPHPRLICFMLDVVQVCSNERVIIQYKDGDRSLFGLDRNTRASRRKIPKPVEQNLHIRGIS